VNIRFRYSVMQRVIIHTFLLTGFLTCFTGTAFAVDGVVLIDQARALAGNVTPGDAPGFPVTLSLPGSYRLSGNLTVPVQVNGIVIQNNEITLDLNGFRIFTTEMTADIAGITDQQVAYRSILIRNGSMTNFGVAMLSDQVEVREMRISNAHFAIHLLGRSAVVTDNRLSDNFIGLRIEGADAIIADNMASRNALGILTGSNTVALISGNNTSFNSYAGIHTGCPSNLVDNIAANNPTYDIYAGPLPTCTRVNNNPTP
jgi:hypothetical protein